MEKMQILKGKINIIIIIVITLLVLFFSLKDDFNNVVNQILSINVMWLIAGILLVASYEFFRGIAFHTFVTNFYKDFSVHKSFRIIVVTQFFNAVTPFSSGGQPYQLYALKKDGVELSKGTNIVIQNFIVYQIALIFLGLVAVLSNHFFHIFKEVGILKDLVTIGFIFNIATIVFSFAIAFGKKTNAFLIKLIITILSKFKIIKDSQKSLDKWQNYINRFHSGAKVLFDNKKKFIFTIFLNIIALTCLYLVPVVILYSTGDYTSFTGLLSIISTAYVMMIGSFVPIPGGSGGLEYGFLQFFGNFVTGTTITTIMLLWRFSTYYVGMILGAIVFNIKERK